MDSSSLSEVRDLVHELQVDLLQVSRCQKSLADKLAKWGVNFQKQYMGDTLPN